MSYYFKKFFLSHKEAESGSGKIKTEKRLFVCMGYFADENGGGSLVRNGQLIKARELFDRA